MSERDASEHGWPPDRFRRNSGIESVPFIRPAGKTFLHPMSRYSRRRLYLAFFLAFLSEWTPRLPFLASRRFWVWFVSVFSTLILSIFVSLKVFRVAPIDDAGLVVVALVMTVPCQTVGMIMQWRWVQRRRKRLIRRGFAVVSPEDEPV